MNRRTPRRGSRGLGPSTRPRTARGALAVEGNPALRHEESIYIRMTDYFTIRPITAAETRLLRHSVLRPHQTLEQLVFPGDDAPDSLHVGAFMDGELVGIASVSRDPLPGESDARAWRLRGMATVEKVRGMGCGRALVEACVAHASIQGGTLLWCNGRTSAMGFYRALGFERVEKSTNHHQGPDLTLFSSACLKGQRDRL
jgi:GNAT superfamily N-acetyltransferase